jgi:carbohydrate-selective porin OprB
MAALCGSVYAQAQKTITIRMLDSRSGKLIATSNFLVRVDHEQTAHANWVTQNEDGTGKLTLPIDATALSVRATYDSTTSFYVNCDADNDHGFSDRAPSPDRWYKISDIVALGVVAPMGCGGKKVTDKLQVVAKPGEFVFFVRKLNPREQFDD